MAVAAFGSGLFAATGMRSHAGQDPSNLTWTRILGVAEAVEGFRTEHGDWPADLAELLDDGLDDDELPLDGWICELRYARTDSGGAVIYSLGGDRRPGGLGQDADLAWFLAAPSLDQD